MSAENFTTLVAIVGGSGSGKTWLAERLVYELGSRALSFSLDNFYRDQSGLLPEARESLNFDLPSAIEWPLFKDTLRANSRRRPFCLPQYDFQEHCRRKHQVFCDPAPIVIIDGLWLLHRADVRQMFDLTLYLECPVEIRMRRRISRDTTERGRTPKASERGFHETVNAMHDIYVAPQKCQAQRIVRFPFGEPEVASLRHSIFAARPSGNEIHQPSLIYDKTIN